MPRYKRNKSDVFVDARNADAIIHKNLNSQRSRSAVAPKELAPNLDTPGHTGVSHADQVVRDILHNVHGTDPYYKYAYLMFYNSLRVSELLQVKCNEIDHLGRFKIHATKGSINRIGEPGELKEYLLRYRGLQRYLLDSENRRTLYYQFRKRGFWLRTGSSSKASVTHLFRHISLKLLKQQGYEEETIQSAAGHRSEESTKYYTG